MRSYTVLLPTPLAVLLLMGCAPSETAIPKAVRAVVSKVDVLGPHPVVQITDAERVTKVFSFFPGILSETDTGMAGGWEAKYKIVFHLSDGRKVHVATSYDDKGWSTGKGDKSLKPGLGAVLDPLFAVDR